MLVKSLRLYAFLGLFFFIFFKLFNKPFALFQHQTFWMRFTISFIPLPDIEPTQIIQPIEILQEDMEGLFIFRESFARMIKGIDD